MSTVRQLYDIGCKMLQEASIEHATYDARALLEWVMDFGHADFILNAMQTVDEEKEHDYMEAIQKRSTHYPLQYIMGQCSFMDFDFLVGEGVLIPRQDTEVLVETVLEREKDVPQHILDLCTGSGCIAISLKKYFPASSVVAVDLSSDALSIAKQNANHLEADVTFLESDLFSNVEGVFDIIVSNPPYIKTKEIDTLMEEVKMFEPMMALDGKEDGLFFYNRLLSDGRRYAKKGTRVYVEIGHDQGREVKALFLKYGYKQVNIRKDLAGLDRIVYGVVD